MRTDPEDDPTDQPRLAHGLEALEVSFKQSSLSLRLEHGREQPVVVIESLRVGRDARYQRRATEALEQLKAVADQAGATLVVRPLEASPSVQEAQIDFYDRHGFALQADGRLRRLPGSGPIVRAHAAPSEAVPDTIPEDWSHPESAAATPPWEQDESFDPFGASDPPAWPMEGSHDAVGDPIDLRSAKSHGTRARLSRHVRVRFALAAGSMFAITMADSWRTLVLAAGACGAVTATRLRFATYVAVGLLLAVTVISLARQGPARTASADVSTAGHSTIPSSEGSNVATGHNLARRIRQ